MPGERAHRITAPPMAREAEGRRRMTRYRTIVADPPWAYAEGWPVGAGQARARGGAAYDARRRTPLPYGSMSLCEIAALPVGAIAEDDAHLYLWTTNRYVFDAKWIAEAWGFNYSQLLVWAKTPMGKGPGGAFAQNAEYVLFCRRGSLAHAEKQDSVWFNWPRTAKHSVKPDARPLPKQELDPS
jgi:hypothetical protein